MRDGGPPPFQPIKDRLASLVPGLKRGMRGCALHLLARLPFVNFTLRAFANA